MGTTSNGLPYPEPTDSVDVVRDVKALADAVNPWVPVQKRSTIVGAQSGFLAGHFPAGTNAAILLGPSTVTPGALSRVRFDFFLSLRGSSSSTFAAYLQLVLDGANPGGSAGRSVNGMGSVAPVDASFSWEGEIIAGTHPWSLAITVNSGSGNVTCDGLGAWQYIVTPI